MQLLTVKIDLLSIIYKNPISEMYGRVNTSDLNTIFGNSKYVFKLDFKNLLIVIFSKPYMSYKECCTDLTILYIALVSIIVVN